MLFCLFAKIPFNLLGQCMVLELKFGLSMLLHLYFEVPFSVFYVLVTKRFLKAILSHSKVVSYQYNFIYLLSILFV